MAILITLHETGSQRTLTSVSLTTVTNKNQQMGNIG